VAILYVTHRLDEIFQIGRHVTVFRDGRKVATVPATDLDHKSLVRMLVGTELDAFRSANEFLVAPTPGQEPVLLNVEHLASGPLRDTSFEVRAGEIVGLAGVTGSGSEDGAGLRDRGRRTRARCVATELRCRPGGCTSVVKAVLALHYIEHDPFAALRTA
jgi:ribose transport system ATP-binding protein